MQEISQNKPKNPQHPPTTPTPNNPKKLNINSEIEKSEFANSQRHN